MIHRLHPVSVLSYTAVIIILAMLSFHPLYLLLQLVSLGVIIICSQNAAEWKLYLKISMWMAIPIIIINTLFNHAGVSSILLVSGIPIVDTINISLEALLFGLVMSLRLLVVMSAFCLITYTIHPDKVLQLASRWGKISALTIALSVRLVPLMASDLKRITQVQRCRGLRLETGGLWLRIKNSIPVISILVSSSLERSWQMAESMDARGFGTGIRTQYSREIWRPRDSLVLGAALVALLTGMTASWYGWSAYTYYPKLEGFKIEGSLIALILMLLLMFPAFLEWGYRRWPVLQSKI